MTRLSLKNRVKGLQMKRGKGKRPWGKSHLPPGTLIERQHLVAFSDLTEAAHLFFPSATTAGFSLGRSAVMRATSLRASVWKASP